VEESYIHKMIGKTDRILVTGGTGFLGKHILEELVKKGYQDILVLSRQEHQSVSDQITYVQGDILDIFQLDDILKNVQAVIHAAGIVSFQKRDRKKMFEVNVEGTSNLINGAMEHRVRSFIHVSSAAAIGKTINDSLIDENTKWNNKLAHTQYALSKFLGEKQAWRGHAEGLPVTVINPTLILGKGDWKSGTSGFFDKIHSGLKYYPTGSNGIVAAHDVAKFISKLMEQPKFGERYILSAENLSYKKLFALIAEELSVNSPNTPIQGIYKGLEFIKESISRLGGTKTQYLTRESFENISDTKAYSNQKSTSSFNFQYQKVADLVHDLSQLYSKQLA